MLDKEEKAKRGENSPKTLSAQEERKENKERFRLP